MSQKVVPAEHLEQRGTRAKRRIELLAPGGDLDSIRAAIKAGADAIYCGLDKFNARHRAANITFDDLGAILALAHRHDCRVYLTLNVIMVESDIPVLVGMLNKLVNTGIDGIIVQDLGLLYLLSTAFKGLTVHASTQLTTHNEGQIQFLGRLGVTSINLCRELDLDEIRALAVAGHEQGVAIEVFVHGSYCLCFSGICYLSSVQGFNSGNRGRCSQPCRDRYLTTAEGRNFPLNLKDNSAYFDLQALVAAGVDALKIEGRMKKFHYVYTVTNTYRKRLDSLLRGDEPVDCSGDLYKVFNRDYSNGFLSGDLGRHMFSDHPRNRSATQLLEEDGRSEGELSEGATEAYDALADFKADVWAEIEHVRIKKAPLTVRVSGTLGEPLSVSVQTPEATFVVASESVLARQRSDSTVPPLDAEAFLQRLKTVNELGYVVDELDLEGLDSGLFVAQKQLALIKQRILSGLNGSRRLVEPADVPVVAKRSKAEVKSSLSVLIDDEQDVPLCNETRGSIHFQLPNALANRGLALGELFAENRRLIPWFPSVLIGEDFAAAAELLLRVCPERIVTNNTGVAHAAWKAGVPWIAGPHLNTANSFSLRSLKESFDCRGAFVSNELSVYQIQRISPPDDFELHYSIFHPMLLLTSRLCLFQQVTGCEKEAVDGACITDCARSAVVTNLKGRSFHVQKRKGSHCSIYNQVSFLNPEIVTDVPFLFSSFLVDLRDIETDTKAALDKPSLLKLFEAVVRRQADSASELRRKISPTTNTLYVRGI